MIVKFTFKNFRSIREEQTFSLEASSSKLKSNNTFQPSTEKKGLTLLKSAVLYGANASGKSNLIRLMWTVRNFILNSTDLKTGDLISENFYDPFLLDEDSKHQPTEFSIDFVPPNLKRHRYIVKYDKSEIVYEYLGIYESSWISKIFERKKLIDTVEFGDGMHDKKEDKKVPKNHLYLSKAGNTTNEQFQEIYLYFKSMEIWNAVPSQLKDFLFRRTETIFSDIENKNLIHKVNKLVSIADTKISRIEVAEKDNVGFSALPDEVRDTMIKKYKYETYGIHPIFENGKQIGEERFLFNNQESQGTKMMFAIGGLILEALERPFSTVLFLDEFDNSLHPDLVRFLIELFHNPKVNVNNSQLIFSTHETSLLDKKIFRKDQIWFSEKNKSGETDFFSLKDFKDLNNLRADIPFDKWYRAGKFGAVPNIRKFEFIAEYEEK
jgi:AAA15 family ATPase/GTPase